MEKKRVTDRCENNARQGVLKTLEAERCENNGRQRDAKTENNT